MDKIFFGMRFICVFYASAVYKVIASPPVYEVETAVLFLCGHLHCSVYTRSMRADRRLEESALLRSYPSCPFYPFYPKDKGKDEGFHL
jgi:hypothetical protein